MSKKIKAPIPVCFICGEPFDHYDKPRLTDPQLVVEIHFYCKPPRHGRWIHEKASARQQLVAALLKIHNDADQRIAKTIEKIADWKKTVAPHVVRQITDADRASDNRPITVSQGRTLRNDITQAFRFFGPLKGKAK